ncbi:MAG: hypothetical protein JXR83_19840 [Deltaproteobacteria bacterium]|nr:hypothetical protein [Deltaproteobacteria bacterium]
MTARPRRVARYGLRLAASIAAPLALLPALLPGCMSRTRLGATEIAGLRTDYQGQRFFLRQSLYYGPFYDDRGRFLVDAHEFSSLRLLTAPDGEVIIPPPAQGIVPAGTEVEVRAIEFPDSAVIVRRPLFTPRYNIWVVLRVARLPDRYQAGDHILVLPSGLRDRAEVRAALDALLSRDDLAPWLASRSAAARLAIAEKRAQTGLSYEELVAAVGLPDRIDRSFERGHRCDRAYYASTAVDLVDDVVVAVGRADDNSVPASQPGA